MIVEIQCLPKPSGTSDEPYAVIAAAIAQVQRSGLRYEVGALGTTIEGDPDEIWPLLRRIHETCLTAGGESVVSILKIAQSADAASGPSMAGLTESYR